MGLDEKGEPIEQAPPPPDPALVAKAMAEAAKADKTKAEAEGIEIDNAGKLLELQQMMTMTQQGLNQLGQMLGAVLALNDPQRAMGGPAGRDDGSGRSDGRADARRRSWGSAGPWRATRHGRHGAGRRPAAGRGPAWAVERRGRHAGDDLVPLDGLPPRGPM